MITSLVRCCRITDCRPIDGHGQFAARLVKTWTEEWPWHGVSMFNSGHGRPGIQSAGLADLSRTAADWDWTAGRQLVWWRHLSDMERQAQRLDMK